jgi:hypothetical protein
MLNSMLVGIMKITEIMKISQYQIQENNYGCGVWFSGLKYTKTCSFHMKKNVEIKNLRKFAIMMCRLRILIII